MLRGSFKQTQTNVARIALKEFKRIGCMGGRRDVWKALELVSCELERQDQSDKQHNRLPARPNPPYSNLCLSTLRTSDFPLSLCG